MRRCGCGGGDKCAAGHKCTSRGAICPVTFSSRGPMDFLAGRGRQASLASHAGSDITSDKRHYRKECRSVAERGRAGLPAKTDVCRSSRSRRSPGSQRYPKTTQSGHGNGALECRDRSAHRSSPKDQLGEALSKVSTLIACFVHIVYKMHGTATAVDIHRVAETITPCSR
jgi:hypothetical protein